MARSTVRSQQVMARSRDFFPGGVNSPVRAFTGVGGDPVVAASGAGALLRDVDGNEYIDYVLSWGPLIHGHAYAPVLAAVQDAMARGTSFGMPTELEVQLAEAVTSRMPHIEMMRFVSSGTEAAMSAVRLARAATGRSAILKFEGCYHGHADAFLVKAGSGVATLGLPNSPGVPDALAALTLTVPFNDLAATEAMFRAHPDAIAAVAVEPVVGNAGFIAPTPEFLAGLRALCDTHGAMLLFDEVMTGFRIAYGGAVEMSGVTPDITCLGKVIGGGLPVAAYGGSRALMANVAPLGSMYQAGTLSGNPLAMAAGLATLDALTREVHDGIARRTATLVQGLREIAARQGVPITADHRGSMFGLFFHPGPVRNYEDAKHCDTALFKRFFHAALDRGVYLAPSAFEAGFVSAAHGDAEIGATLDRLDAALQAALQA
jgi:glutamate-1-semialdehyde 2,1-aminomutase